MKHFWVNVYTGPYAGCKGSPKYYLSMSYDTKKEAIAALRTGKGQSMTERYITTTKIVVPK